MRTEDLVFNLSSQLDSIIKRHQRLLGKRYLGVKICAGVIDPRLDEEKLDLEGPERRGLERVCAIVLEERVGALEFKRLDKDYGKSKYHRSNKISYLNV
jgi:hypothetical protein